MGQAFITRRGNNYGVKKIEAPEIYTDTTKSYISFKFPLSLFPNSSDYIVFAQYRAADGSIRFISVPIKAGFPQDTNTYRNYTGGWINHRGDASIYADKNNIIMGIGINYDTALADEIPNWTFEKGFIYEFK